jgi:hypothetical protein
MAELHDEPSELCCNITNNPNKNEKKKDNKEKRLFRVSANGQVASSWLVLEPHWSIVLCHRRIHVQV